MTALGTPLRLLAPTANFGAGSGLRTVPVLAFDHLLDGVRRPEAWDEATRLAAGIGAAQIVDLACGDGRGLDRLAQAGLTAARIGVDLRSAVGVALRRGCSATLHAADLESETALHELAGRLASPAPQLYLLVDALERLRDPRPLLRTVRRLLFQHRDNRLLLSVVDRVPTRGSGPPPDPTHVRQWTAAELGAFLTAAGFRIDATVSPGDGTVLFTVGADRAAFARQLDAQGLPSAAARLLLVSTEHALCRVTGGIGSYCAQLERARGDELAFFYAGDPDQLSVDRARLRWIFRDTFVPAELAATLPLAELVDEAVRAALFLYDGVETVEVQDYLGIGARTVQARRAGLLPEPVRVEVRAHGSRIYIEQCFGRLASHDELPQIYEEKVALEQADRVSFPTRFLRTLYREQGYRIAEEASEIRPLPFDLDGARPLSRYRAIDTLIFFGKRTPMKGFPLFLDAVGRALDGGAPLSRLLVIGRREDEAEPRALDALRARLEVIEFEGTSREAVEQIRANADHALTCLPYRADNHPLSLLEALATGCPVLAAATGGIPEMVPAALHPVVLHAFTAAALAEAIARELARPVGDRAALVQATLEVLAAAQRASATEHPRNLPSPRAAAASTTVGVAVPCFDTDLAQLDDLIFGLHQQRRPPDRVCFVDDGSRAGYHDQLRAFLADRLALPFIVVRHPVNRGLSAARNSALRALDTDYVVNLDADDVPRPDLLRLYAHWLDRSPEVVAVSSWLESFTDGADFRSGDACRLIYRPLGDGLVLAQTENCLGHANAAFRRRALLDLGGFDEQDRSMWEDWALYVKILSSGGRIGVVPRSDILYRVRAGSMARTYDRFPAMMRVARSLEALPRFDALRLQAELRDAEAGRERSRALEEENAALRARLEPGRFHPKRQARRVADALRRMF